MKNCHCGRPLHYSNWALYAWVEAMIREHGETVVVSLAGRSWKVPRHYLALHGLKASELEKLGFVEEVTE